MNNIADRYEPELFDPTLSVRLALYASLLSLSETYYLAVKYTDSALEAYCEHKTDVEACLLSDGEVTGFESMPNFDGATQDTYYNGTGGGFPASTLGTGGRNSCVITEYNSVCTGDGCNYWVESKPCT